MMTIKTFVSVLLVLYILNVVNGYYWHWYTTDRMKIKFIVMKVELVKDAIRNVQRVDQFKEDYTISTVYDIGQMLYFIRSKFARMVRLFILANENNKNHKSFHLHLPSLKEIHHLSMEIYSLIEMLEEYEAGSDKRASPLQRLKKSKLAKKLASKMAQKLTPDMSSLPPNFLDLLNPRLLRQKPIDVHNTSSAKWATDPRKRNGAFRNRMKVNTEKDFDGAFESEFE